MRTSLESKMSGLGFKHLRGFVAVAQTGHFGRAAGQLQIGQPLLSQMILRLEETLGTKLLVRRPAVRLTATGEVFLAYARRALEEIDSGAAAVAESASGLLGHLNLGFPTLLSLSWLPESIAAFHRSHPRVRISYFDFTTSGQLHALRAGTIDIGFVRQNSSDSEDVEVVPIDREPLVLAMASGHPLSRQQELEATDLSRQPFILFPRNTAPRLFDSIVEQARDAGLELDLPLEARDWLTVVGLVRAGAGLSFVPVSLMNIGLPGLAFREVCGVQMETTLSIAHMTHLEKPVVSPFIDAVRDFRSSPDRYNHTLKR